MRLNRYILVPYYQGAITLLSGHAERLKVLGEASSHFNRFINLLNDYGITESKKDTTSTSRDPCTARNRKIEEYHRIKALEEKELSFERMIEDRKDGCDEELLRDYYKLKIENCKAKAVSELQMISKEQEILELKSNNISEIQKAPPEENNSGTARSTPFESLTIISEDQGSLRNSVFNWGLSKPTMTVEQFIESQVRTIGKPLKGGTIPKKEGDECADDYELNDIKTENMRKWDEYKDTSPCGWGNRRNRG